jgi:hypothetical protein
MIAEEAMSTAIASRAATCLRLPVIILRATERAV